MSKKEQEKFKCKCGRTFSNAQGLGKHVKHCDWDLHTKETNAKPHECPKCGRTFKLQAHLARHMQARHRSPKKSKWGHTCPTCGAHESEFKHRNSFTTHCTKCAVKQITSKKRKSKPGTRKNRQPRRQKEDNSSKTPLPVVLEVSRESDEAIEIPIKIKVIVSVERV